MSITFDIVILLVLAYGFFSGFKKGLIQQLFVIGSIILGIIAARIFYLPGARALSKIITNPVMAKIVSFTLIFAATSIGLSIVAFFIGKTMEALSLKWVDHIFGAIFGFLKVSIVISVIIVLLVNAPVPVFHKWIDNSILSPFFLFLAKAIVFLLPPEIGNGLKGFLS